MSKNAQSAGAAKPGGPEPEISFEDALKKLEGIVDAMESDELPLETLLVRFEEGNRLLQFCQTKLSQAEQKIQQLERNSAGQIVSKTSLLSEEAGSK